MIKKVKATSVSEYVASLPKNAKKNFSELRGILKKLAPNAKEAIKWGSPVLEEGRILFAYTAYKNHMNFMATSQSMMPFKSELKNYTCGKDTIQFSYDKPLPKALIIKIARHRINDVKVNDAKWMY